MLQIFSFRTALNEKDEKGAALEKVWWGGWRQWGDKGVSSIRRQTGPVVEHCGPKGATILGVNRWR